jgi:hypothetical protein
MRKKVSNRKGNHKERRCQIKQKRKNVFFLHLTPHEGLFHKCLKKKKKQRRSGQAPGRTCTSLSHNDGKRSHGENTPNHLVNHVCKCVRFILFVSLTTVFASLSAPASNKSCTVAVWP